MQGIVEHDSQRSGGICVQGVQSEPDSSLQRAVLSGPEFATTTMVYQIYYRAFENFDLGASLAQSVLMMLIPVVFAVIQFEWLGGEVEYL